MTRYATPPASPIDDPPSATPRPDIRKPVRKVGRPSTAAPLSPRIVQWLSAEPKLSGADLLRRARDAGYRGGKSALYDLVRRLRRPPSDPALQLGILPGIVSRHGFARVDIPYATGETERVYFLASRLEWSRFLDVRLARHASEQELIRCLLASFETFGGAPLITVWNHARLVALSWEGRLVNWNPLFAQVALDYRFVPEFERTRPALDAPGSPPSLARWVKETFFRARRFRDGPHLEQQLATWLDGVNRRGARGASIEGPVLKLAQEQVRLRPLPIAPGRYALRLRTARPPAVTAPERRRSSRPPIGYNPASWTARGMSSPSTATEP
jgi:transposase